MDNPPVLMVYSDLQRLRLFVWELQQLYETMVLEDNPQQKRLEGLLDRYFIDTEGDR